MNRRSFLKLIGATPLIGLSGCKPDPERFVRSNDELFIQDGQDLIVVKGPHRDFLDSLDEMALKAKDGDFFIVMNRPGLAILDAYWEDWAVRSLAT